MIIFEYKVSPAWLSPDAPESIFRITVTSDKENNDSDSFAALAEI